MATHSSILAWRIPGTESCLCVHIESGMTEVTQQQQQILYKGFLGGSDRKESTCIARDLGLILGSGRSPGEGNGNPLQYSCLGNSMQKNVNVLSSLLPSLTSSSLPYLSQFNASKQPSTLLPLATFTSLYIFFKTLQFYFISIPPPTQPRPQPICLP